MAQSDDFIASVSEKIKHMQYDDAFIHVAKEGTIDANRSLMQTLTFNDGSKIILQDETLARKIIDSIK